MAQGKERRINRFHELKPPGPVERNPKLVRFTVARQMAHPPNTKQVLNIKEAVIPVLTIGEIGSNPIYEKSIQNQKLLTGIESHSIRDFSYRRNDVTL